MCVCVIGLIGFLVDVRLMFLWFCGGVYVY